MENESLLLKMIQIINLPQHFVILDMHSDFFAEVLMVFLSIEIWSERIISGNTFQFLFWFLTELVDKD